MCTSTETSCESRRRLARHASDGIFAMKQKPRKTEQLRIKPDQPIGNNDEIDRAQLSFCKLLASNLDG